MPQFLITMGVAIALAALAIPIIAMLLVSVASRREESAHTLSGHAPGPITSAARQLLAYRAQTSRAVSSGQARRPAIETIAMGRVPAPAPAPDEPEPAGTRAA